MNRLGRLPWLGGLVLVAALTGWCGPYAISLEGEWRIRMDQPAFLCVSMGNEQLAVGKDNPFLARHTGLLAKKVRYGSRQTRATSTRLPRTRTAKTRRRASTVST